MGNEFKGLKAHSAEHFGDSRDFWWHDDYLALCAEKWRIDEIHRVLDVGSGVGHWGRRLARVLAPDVSVVGVEPDPLWVAKAKQRADEARLSARFSYVEGRAEALPFDDASFDLTTCQTVLMHLADPARALAEMVRVTRPGGLVIAAEPSNVYGPVLLGALANDEPIDETVRLVSFQLRCQQGRRNSNEGDAGLGERLPGLFYEAGLAGIEVRMDDRGAPLVPPYASPHERASIEELIDAVDREIWLWPRAETLRYFLAGGGKPDEFDPLWSAAMAQRRREVDAIRAGTFSCGGGGIFYLVWGWRRST